MIVDPFDRTYNPGKSVMRGESLEKAFFKEMRRALKSLTEHGVLPEKPSEPEKRGKAKK